MQLQALIIHKKSAGKYGALMVASMIGKSKYKCWRISCDGSRQIGSLNMVKRILDPQAQIAGYRREPVNVLKFSGYYRR
jgi:hypothetical protein